MRSDTTSYPGFFKNLSEDFCRLFPGRRAKEIFGTNHQVVEGLYISSHIHIYAFWPLLLYSIITFIEDDDERLFDSDTTYRPSEEIATYASHPL